jgi:putative transposase
MQRVSPYLKMRVLGAIEFAPGKTNVERIKHVATLTFADEADRRFQFTWRTIPTWYSRYKKDGITTMSPKQRSDKGRTRKVEPEAVHEAIEHVRGSFRKGQANLAALYRTCIERGLLVREQVAPNTFRRIVKRHELLKPDPEVQDKRRLSGRRSLHAPRYDRRGHQLRSQLGKVQNSLRCRVWKCLRYQFGR